ncbi:MAG: potassium-dependent mechanosensitive channel [Mucilaginibacter sp.]|nr:potassium-dependent mechanosensitive channel [Mucilaginibacter sp.]
MHNLLKLSFVFSLTLLITVVANDCNAQHKKTKSHGTVRDSLRRAVMKRDSMMRTFKHSDNSVNGLLQKLEYYNSLYNQDLSDFSQGFDTLEINQHLPSLEKRMPVMSTIIENDHSSTLSYLFTIRYLISHVKDDLDNWQKELSENTTKMDKIHNDILDFKKDTAMNKVPADSMLRVRYLPQITQIQNKWERLDTAIDKAVIKLGLLQNRVTALDLLYLDINDRIDLKIHDFTARSLTNEYGYIWQSHRQNVIPFDTVASKTSKLNLRLLKYFIDPKATSRINIVSHLVTLAVLMLFFAWIYTSRRKLVRLKDNFQSTLDQTDYIVKHPFVSSLIIALILGLYFYDQPPFIFLEILLLGMTVCIVILVKAAWPKPFFKFWLGIFVLTIFYAASNLFTQVCYADRIFLMILSLASILLAVWFLKETRASTEEYPWFTRSIVIVFIICNGISFVLNFIGRFSLAKIIGVTTDFNLCLGFGFFLLIHILMESLFLQLEANKIENSSFTSYLDFKILQNKFKNVLVKIVAVLWTIKLLENLDIDDYIYGKATDFLTHSYKVGTTAFTFGSIVIFVGVLWLSIIISRVISYFYDYAEQQSTSSGDAKKNKTSILLIRLSVFSIGFIAAIMFSGIPLTQVTIVVGALGVGIGFGLQNIVNNLVSGVILAFEKPVQVGDIIEVGNRSGTIKEIGIRASKIEAGDGSELIVPNGDLISQHVVNWTLHNTNRRVELIVGVAYGSDIDKVEAILKRIVRNRQDIMQTPPPMVFLHNFSSSSVDFRLLFWAADIDKWVSLKSDVMAEVYTEFSKEGIEIPHPKRDIQVFFPEGTSAEIKNPDLVAEISTQENPMEEASREDLPKQDASKEDISKQRTPKENPPGKAQ